MSTEQILRAWKDVRYRQSLSEADQALVPAHPAGTIELSASELTRLSGEDGLEMAAASFLQSCSQQSNMLRCSAF